MREQDQLRFPRTEVALRDGRKVTIRALAADDAEALADFYESIPEEDHRFYWPHPLTREKAAAKASEALHPFFTCLLAETQDRQIAGYAWFRWQDGNSRSSTLGVCIRQNFQGMGAGTALLRRLLEIAQTVGPPVMSLTVQKANPRGLGLYRKMGFHVVREQLREGDSEPEYYMERKVRPL